MSKFHINPKTGEPGVCSAQPGNCRFTESPHFDNADAARAHYEETQSFPKIKSVTMSTDVVGEIDADGFVESTYPRFEGFTPKPVRAVVKDEATGRTGFIAGKPMNGYITHVIKDRPSSRQGMGVGNLVISARPICGKSRGGVSPAFRIDGGHNDPTPPSEALANDDSRCTACAKKFADPNFS